MEKFSEVYDSMMHSYNEIEVTMGSLIESGNNEAFLLVARNAQNYLTSIATLINSYCPSEMKDACISELERKEATLSQALEDVREKAL